MKKYIYSVLFLLLSKFTIAQTTIQPTIVKEGNYTVTASTGAEHLRATQSITLKPDSWIKSGSTFSAAILDNPYTSINFSNENYVFTRSFQTAMTSFNPSIAKESDVIENITYFDGLGRPKQNINIKGSPNKKDIVTHIEYDSFGRSEKEFLPVESSGNIGNFRLGAKNETINYYKTHYPDDINNTNPNPFSMVDFESSPINRVEKQAAPGYDWRMGGGHEIEFNYLTNINRIRLYRVALTLTNNTFIPSLVDDGYYSPNELYITETKDENHSIGVKHTAEEFKDKQGRVVLKRTYSDTAVQDTYYVYDDYGNLTYVIPPMVVLIDGVSTTELNELCYQYRYDHRNRLVEKKLPGKGLESIIYNKLDQPIMTQDANQKENNEWLFTKYDAFGRVAYAGIAIDARPRYVIQNAEVDQISTQWVTRSSNAQTIGGTQLYYTNTAYPTITITKILTINYYDSYVDAAGITIPSTVYEEPITNQTKNLPTVSKVRVLDTDHWITTVIGYDKKARAIYTATKNPYLETTDIIENNLDFAGKVVSSKTTHSKTNQPAIITEDVLTYDHQGRLKKQTQQINNQSNETIVENSYDELGQLILKEVGDGLQEIDYKYNIRGWLKSINEGVASGNDLFGFKLNYNDPTTGTALYNGSISQTFWDTKSVNNTSNPVSKSYLYEYDALNRLTKATDNTGNYNVYGITYDKNGNLTHLNRKDTNGVMDNLSYTYANNGLSNQLVKVEDTGSFEGFKNGTSEAYEYLYDNNGNMVKDKNKNIDNITYNHLNLPVFVELATGNITYTYDAAGVKLSKQVITNGFSPDIKKTFYAGNYIYEENFSGETLKFFSHPEGYVEPENGGFNYVYQYKDHLGNIRLSYSDSNNDGQIQADSEIIEENNYYPFGLKHKGYNNVVNGTHHPYTFNGKEEQEELGLNWHDYGARMYDAALGRWHSTDNKAEFYFANSPYVYALNTPINAIDPDGNLVIFINGLGGGGQNYWRGTRLVPQTYTYNPFTRQNEGHNFKKVSYAFDLSVSRQLGDNNRMYIDGSPGSIFNNFTSGQRFSQGYDEGLKQAAAIIGSLARDPQGNITETIKIVTHSMGGVYGKGFVSALKYYIKTSKDPQVRKALITLVADFDPFQAGGKLGKADENTYTQQFINAGWLDLFNAGWLANQEEEGADEVVNNKKTSHFIDTFLGNIDQLQEGTYEWNKDKQEWVCTNCN